MSEAVSHARTLIDRGDVRGAATALRRAEQAGDAQAARELALWCLSGGIVRRDLATSRALFERAAALGDDDSAAISRAFIAVGVGGPADWPRALEMLRAAAARDSQAAAQIQIIEAMALGPNGEPLASFASETLSEDPEVRRFSALCLTADRVDVWYVLEDAVAEDGAERGGLERQPRRVCYLYVAVGARVARAG